MNYLAHLFLSGESTSILVGNFIGDSVRGNQFSIPTYNEVFCCIEQLIGSPIHTPWFADPSNVPKP